VDEPWACCNPVTNATTAGVLEVLIKEACPRLAGWRAWLCGNPALVLSLRKKAAGEHRGDDECI
jgi:hypothetical protein